MLKASFVSSVFTWQSSGPKSSVDDLCAGRGVVLGRAATILRSIETQPFDWMICLVSQTSRPLEGCEKKAELFRFKRLGSAFLFAKFFLSPSWMDGLTSVPSVGNFEKILKSSKFECGLDQF